MISTLQRVFIFAQLRQGTQIWEDAEIYLSRQDAHDFVLHTVDHDLLADYFLRVAETRAPESFADEHNRRASWRSSASASRARSAASSRESRGN